MVEFPYLAAAGFFTPESLFDLESFDAIKPLAIALAEIGETEETKRIGDDLYVSYVIPDPDSRSLSMTNPPKRKVSLLLAAKFGFGVAEREDWTLAGQRILTVHNTNWARFGNDAIWLPQTSTRYYFTDFAPNPKYSSLPVSTTEFQLKAFDPGPHESSFDLAASPQYKIAGTSVTDHSVSQARTNTSHAVGYFIAADGSLLLQTGTRIASQLTRTQRFAGTLILIALAVPPIVSLVKKARKVSR